MKWRKMERVHFKYVGGLVLWRVMAENPEGRPPIEERIAELKAEGKIEGDIVLLLHDEGYPTEEVMEHVFPRGREEPPKTVEEPAEERPHFEDRLEELEASEMAKKDVCRTLIFEGYNPRLLVAKFGGLYAKVMRQIKAERGKEEAPILGAIAGPTKGPGWLEEVKEMVRSQMSRSRELTEVFSDIGLGILLASLSKSGMNMEEFQKIALKREGLRESLIRAGETAFKALEYFESDLVSSVEAERDDARAYASYLESQWVTLSKQLDPKFRLEKMIQTYLLSGGADGDILMSMIDKWISIEFTDMRLELMR